MQAPHEKRTLREEHDLALHLVGRVLSRPVGLNFGGLSAADLRLARARIIESRWDMVLPTVDSVLRHSEAVEAHQREIDEALAAGRTIDCAVAHALGVADHEVLKKREPDRFTDPSDGRIFFAYWWRADEPSLWAAIGVDAYRRALGEIHHAREPRHYRELAAMVWKNLAPHQRAVFLEQAA